MKKKPFTIKTLNKEDAKNIDHDFDIAYKNKIESINYQLHTSAIDRRYIKSFQEMEHGRYEFIAKSTAVEQHSVDLMQTYREIFSIQVTPIGMDCSPTVLSYTGSSMEVIGWITSTTMSANAFFYTVVGSLE